MQKHLERVKNTARKRAFVIGNFPLVCKLLVSAPSVLPCTRFGGSMTHQRRGLCLRKQLIPPIRYLFKRDGFTGNCSVIFYHYKVAQSLFNHRLGVGMVFSQRGLGVFNRHSLRVFLFGCPYRTDCQSDRNPCAALAHSLYCAFH